MPCDINFEVIWFLPDLYYLVFAGSIFFFLFPPTSPEIQSRYNTGFARAVRGPSGPPISYISLMFLWFLPDLYSLTSNKTITVTVPPTAWAVIVTRAASPQKKDIFGFWVPFSKAASPLRSRTRFRIHFRALRARAIIALSPYRLQEISDLY